MIIFALGLLAGNRNTDGSFNNRGVNTNLWSSTESGTSAWKRNLNSGNSTVNRNTNAKANGFSVRCLKHWNANFTNRNANLANQSKFKNFVLRISRKQITRIK